MRLVVIIVAPLTIVGVAALGLVLAQKGATPTTTAASTVRIASATQEVSALPARAPISQIAQATGSEASPLILRANVDAQSGSPMTTVTQAPSVAAAAPNVKDQKSEHYFQGYGPRDRAIEGRCHGVGTQIARACA